MSRISMVVAAASTLLMGCPQPNECTSSTQCGAGQSCVGGKCMGGAGGGAAGGVATGGGSRGSTAGGSTGGGTGGGASAGGSTGSGGESCAMPGMAQANSTITDTTVGASADVNLACTGTRNAGPDKVYAVTVPPMTRLVVTATPEQAADGGEQFDVSVYVVAGPAANCSPADAGDRTSCLAGADDPRDPAVIERTSFTNTSTTPRDVFVVVDSYFAAPDPMNGVTNVGGYTLRIDMAAPPMGDLCDSATSVTPGTLSGQTLSGFLPDYGTSSDPNCVTGDGEDRAYTISVPAGQRLTATVTPDSDAGFDPFLNLVAGPASACAAQPLVCLDGSDTGGVGRGETTSYLNRGTAAQSVFVIVGNFDATDTNTAFSLTTALAQPPAGDDCTAPTALTAGTPSSGQTMATFFSDFGGGSGCAGTPTTGPDRVYSISVPPNKTVTVTATPDAMIDTSVSLLDGPANCAPVMRCLAGSASSPAGMPDSVVWTNRGAAPVNVLVVVDSSAIASGGTFTINAELTDPPMGDFCSSATPLPANTTLAGTTAGFANDYTSAMSSTCAGFNTLGNDRVYGFSVPNGQRAKVTLIADAGFAPSLSLVTGMSADCEAAPRVCVAAADSQSNTLSDGGFVLTPRTAGFFNGSGAAATGFAIVDGPTGAGGQFTIAFTSSAPPADDTCTTATTTLPTTPLMNQSLRPAGVVFERDYACTFSRGPDRVYIAQAPPMQRFNVTVTPTPMAADGGFDPSVSVIAGPATACDSPTRRCLAGSNSAFRNAPETTGFSNVTQAAQTVYVVVGATSDSADQDTSFSISSATTPVQAGDVCENAQVITSGMALPTESTAAFFRDYPFASARGCRSGSGPDRVYSISVGAGQTLTVRGVPDAMSDIVLNVVDGPVASCNVSALTCLASADRGAAGAEDRLTWMNTSGAPKTVFVVVSRYTPGAMTYSLEVTAQ